MIHMENLWKVYKTGTISVEALKGINFSVEEGEFVSINGAFRLREIHFDEYYRLPR